ncbi:MAG: transporter [Chloroflexi bacterium]|uniref:Transporter n=1 Tax=Candidatus Chlorohelix allophototropha TaxID=3003348 RepID=A0A8T7M6I9_9CHLR|nr:transporter [Chloroflexota bacterium]WJW69636.1 transporter [Chloroflexota bacterium L227-S17]
MIQLLIDNPLLLLALVAAIGYPLGQIKVGGSSLGVAAVLFVGIAFGALDPNVKLPEIVYQLGLILFVYTVGLTSGPGFFASFRRSGFRDNLMVGTMLLLAAIMAFGANKIFEMKATITAGLYAGSLTNTPALAGALEYIKTSAPKDSVEQMLAEPVVSYSVAYPMGVIGMIVVIYILQKVWKIDYAKESRAHKEFGNSGEKLINLTVLVQNPEVGSYPVQGLIRKYRWEVVLSRIKHENRLSLVGGKTQMLPGDLVSIIGTEEDVKLAANWLGVISDEQIDMDRSELDFRRMFVSNRQVVGHTIRSLRLHEKVGAILTRIRRGDVEFLAQGDTVLELGDRVRVVAPPKRMAEVGKILGDSYHALSEIDIMSFSLGLALGLLVGAIPIPLPGGITFKLGNAGGPLIVALILGKIHHTGRIVWDLPYSANLLVRQLGLVFFLAAIGTRAGYPFVSTFTKGGGVLIFLIGIVITVTMALLTLFIGHKVFKIPMGVMLGILAGLQTQPAVLGFALEQTKNDLPNIGYSTVYPVAIISKILFTQILLTLLL